MSRASERTAAKVAQRAIVRACYQSSVGLADCRGDALIGQGRRGGPWIVNDNIDPRKFAGDPACAAR